jgi:SAM-dependent methyltransferase
MATAPIYDRIGRGYSQRRRPDPRIVDGITRALGDARTVANVGAGAGSYEPEDRDVVAVEPSEVMISQRSGGAAPVVRGVAEALPFADRRFDAALAVLTVHHWTDPGRGLAELRRVAPRQVVLTGDTALLHDFWLNRDYLGLPKTFDDGLPSLGWTVAVLAPARIEPVPVPHDCHDGFYAAYWRRPEAYLDPDVRAAISCFGLIAPDIVDNGLRRLAADLDSGAWHRRNAELLDLDELDLGYRLIIGGR